MQSGITDEFEALDRARAEFEKRLRAVGDGQWDQPTPCEGWTVRDLVQHVVGADRMSKLLLSGAEAVEAVQAMVGDEVLGDDPVASFNAAADALRTAFRVPGARDRTVHHPIGDIPAEMLLGFRITDLSLHAWDLARAIGADEQLDEELVRSIWERMQPIAGFVTGTGLFGAGPSGEVPDDAPVQARLLDLAGRRP